MSRPAPIVPIHPTTTGGPARPVEDFFNGHVRVLAGRLAEMDRASAAHRCQSSDRHTITLDGASARQEDQVCVDAGSDYLIEVLMVNDSRFYKINLSSRAAFTDEDRATFDRVLASFRFGG